MSNQWDLALGVGERGAPLPAITRAVVGIERRGMGLDSAFCAAAAVPAQADEAEVLAKLDGLLAEVNWHEDGPEERASIWRSPTRLTALLHTPLGLNIPPSPIWKKGALKKNDIAEGKCKTDGSALAYLAAHHPKWRPWLLELLKYRKIVNSLKYLEKLPLYMHPDGRVHPSYGPAGDDDDRVGAITGRLAAKNPEVQQIPSNDTYHVRRAFAAAPGKKLIECDYSALEVVILAHILVKLFGDYQLADTLASGQDIHAVNALLVFRDRLKRPGLEGLTPADVMASKKLKETLRSPIKAICYGIMYSKGAWGFGNTLLTPEGDPIGEDAATEMMEGLLSALPGLRRYQEWVASYIRKNCKMVAMDGRVCSLSDLIPGDDWEFKKAYRRALNFPMQAGGAAIVGRAMVAVDQDPWLASHGWGLVNQEHDSLLVEGPEESAEEAGTRLHSIMVNAYPHLAVPLAATWKSGYNREETK